MASKNVVLVKGDPIQKEGIAGVGTIKPGHLIDFDGSGDLQLHGDVGGKPVARVAKEPDLVGGGMEHEYAEDDTVIYWHPRIGDELRVRLASGNNVDAIGLALTSNGDGTLKLAGSGDEVLFHSREAPGSSGEETLLHVERVTSYAVPA